MDIKTIQGRHIKAFERGYLNVERPLPVEEADEIFRFQIDEIYVNLQSGPANTKNTTVYNLSPAAYAKRAGIQKENKIGIGEEFCVN